MGVMVFLSRSSEEQANVFVVGLISQVPLAFWNRATVPEATEALPTWRRYCGDVVPMPTLPACVMWNSDEPVEEEISTMSFPAKPCTVNTVEVEVVFAE